MKNLVLTALLLATTLSANAGPHTGIHLPNTDAQTVQAPALPTMGTVGIFIFIAVIAVFAMLILRRQER